MVPLRVSITKFEWLPDDPTAFVPSMLWKLPFITTWDDSQNQSHPTDSAEEAFYGEPGLAGTPCQGTAEAGPVEAAQSHAGGGHSGAGDFRDCGDGVSIPTGATARPERTSTAGTGSTQRAAKGGSPSCAGEKSAGGVWLHAAAQREKTFSGHDQDDLLSSRDQHGFDCA